MSWPTFDEIMAKKFPSYEWESLDVHTSDGYILTLNHIWKDGVTDQSKGPVLFQHGNLQDGPLWLDEFDETPNPFMMFADLGHHVYLGNNRGTRSSQRHEFLDAVYDAVYWDFTWADMAKDVLANVEKMYTNTPSTAKGHYVGYSQGTIQMLVALIESEEQLADKLQNVVLLTPCTVALTATEPDLSLYSMENNDRLRPLGIHSHPSMNWDIDRVIICHELDSFECAWARFIPGDYPGVVATKNEAHWG